MRLPIALSPLNVFLLLLMLLSPFLGRKTKEYIASNQQEQKIEEWVSAVSITGKNENPTETSPIRSTKTSPIKKTRTPLPSKNQFHNQNEELPLGQSLIAKYREKGKITPRSLRTRTKARVESTSSQNNHNAKLATNQSAEIGTAKTTEIETAKTAESMEDSSKEKQRELFELIRKYAKSGDQENAEKAFMETLENMDIAPLETLERLSAFREHFNRLSEQLSS